MKYEDEPSPAVLIGLIALILILFISIMGYAWVQLSSLMPQQPKPAPTTYETGLYVESEQVQQTIDGREIQ